MAETSTARFLATVSALALMAMGCGKTAAEGASTQGEVGGGTAAISTGGSAAAAEPGDSGATSSTGGTSGVAASGGEGTGATSGLGGDADAGLLLSDRGCPCTISDSGRAVIENFDCYCRVVGCPALCASAPRTAASGRRFYYTEACGFLEVSEEPRPGEGSLTRVWDLATGELVRVGEGYVTITYSCGETSAPSRVTGEYPASGTCPEADLDWSQLCPDDAGI